MSPTALRLQPAEPLLSRARTRRSVQVFAAVVGALFVGKDSRLELRQ